MSQIILHSLIIKTGSWTIRIDPPHGDKEYDYKHVHILKKRLNGEYSWNEDGSRHDKHKFPNQEKYIEKAKELAAKALNLPTGTFQLITINKGKIRYIVETLNENERDMFRTYIAKNKIIIIMLSAKGLVSIIIPLGEVLDT